MVLISYVTQTLQQNYDDIVRRHSYDIRLSILEEMTIDKDLNLPHIVTKPYSLPLKQHKFVEQEIKNLLEAGLIERSMSPYMAPIIIVPRKVNWEYP